MQPILLFHIDQIASATNSMATTASSVTTFNQDSNTASNTTTPDAHTTTAGGTTMEIVIRRVGMEDHINIVKLFQVCLLFMKDIFI